MVNETVGRLHRVACRTAAVGGGCVYIASGPDTESVKQHANINGATTKCMWFNGAKPEANPVDVVVAADVESACQEEYVVQWWSRLYLNHSSNLG